MQLTHFCRGKCRKGGDAGVCNLNRTLKPTHCLIFGAPASTQPVGGINLHQMGGGRVPVFESGLGGGAAGGGGGD